MALIADGFDEDTRNVIIEDDGSGFNLHIPAFLIDKRAATAIKEALDDKQHVVLKATFELNLEKDEMASYDLWFGSVLDLDPKLI